MAPKIPAVRYPRKYFKRKALLVDKPNQYISITQRAQVVFPLFLNFLEREKVNKNLAVLNRGVIASQCRSTGVAIPRIFKLSKASSPCLLLLEKVAPQGRMWRGPGKIFRKHPDERCPPPAGGGTIFPQCFAEISGWWRGVAIVRNQVRKMELSLKTGYVFEQTHLLLYRVPSTTRHGLRPCHPPPAGGGHSLFHRFVRSFGTDLIVKGVPPHPPPAGGTLSSRRG